MTAPLHLVSEDDRLALALQAADRIFDDPEADIDFEPDDAATAAAAVAQLAERWARAGGTVRQMIANARAGAEVLSDDPLQGLSEILQNADDADATTVRYRLDGDRLLVTHNGRPVVLKDVHSLASPWLTTKHGHGKKLGRFGIGMSTLHAIASAFELHFGPYHVRFGEPNLENIAPPELPAGLGAAGTTVLVVHLREDALTPHGLLSWAQTWDDSGLLFCSTLERIIFDAAIDTRTLTLEWSDQCDINTMIAGEELSARRRTATAPDGRRWVVTTAEPLSPKGVTRSNKKTDPTTPIGVALALDHEVDGGELYAGLPLVPSRLPLRVNAQLDPVTGRRALAERSWNDAVLALAAELWAHAVLDLFERNMTPAWYAVPLSGDIEATGAGPAARFELLVLESARTSIPERLTFAVQGARIGINRLATPVPELEELLTDDELAALAEVDAALPTSARDERGRWRQVLADWRENGAEIPEPVTVGDALVLIEDPARSPSSVIALASAAIHADLQEELGDLKCVVASDGHRLRPPDATSTQVLVTRVGGLASDLGMAVLLHAAYAAKDAQAATVLGWLRSRDTTTDGNDPRAIVARLSAAGLAGSPLVGVLDDHRLRSVRDAFETLAPDDWNTFGPGVGRAIQVEAFHFDSRRRKVACISHPSDAYLPKAIDREIDGFAVAAATTPGITWITSRYAIVLRSGLGRAGLGAQKFLGILGAKTAPRVVRHEQLQTRYAYERRLGLPRSTLGSPPARGRHLDELGADYTLEDFECPDLDAVLVDIAKDRKATARRQRAAAVLATLGRAWPNVAESTQVDAAHAHHQWRHKGATRSWWLWRAATIEWLDNSAAQPTAPANLRLRTSGTVAVHGQDDDDYLHRAFDSVRRDVLSALGVAGEPSTADLVGRLREVRDGTGEDRDEATNAAVVYRALSQRLVGTGRMPGDLGLPALRRAFNQGDGLVRTALGWRPATQVLRGTPVFGSLRAFVPQVSDSDRLWQALNVRQPEIDDCLDVLGQLGRTNARDTAAQTISLETLRLLVQLVSPGPVTEAQRKRLAKVALWTSEGWSTARPIYAVDDPVLAAGLVDDVAVWRPGGALSQFAPLIGACRLTPVVGVAHADTAVAEVDEGATILLRDAIAILHEDLARNDPATHSTLRTSWTDLAEFDVRVTDRVCVIAEGLEGGFRTVEVAAYADAATRAIFVIDPDAVETVEAGGHAIAALFGADRRRVAHAWLAAVHEARVGRAATELQLAAERAETEKAATEADIAERLAAFQKQTAQRRSAAGGNGKPSDTGGPARSRRGAAKAPPPNDDSTKKADPLPPRVLVDPSRLVVVDSDGKIVRQNMGETKSRRGGRRRGGLPDPKPGGAAPRGRSGPRSYTDLEKETLGFELACRVLASDADDMIDLRAQHGVGADAVNKLRQFFELKVYVGAEPDTVNLEPSQISRAMSTPEFFLVVVSNIEGEDARPKVRVIVDPVAQLGMVQTSQVRLDGVRNSQSLVFELTSDSASVVTGSHDDPGSAV